MVQGKAGHNPEVKKLSSGVSTLTLSLATNEYWKDKETKEKKERTDWHRVVFYGQAAEIINQYVKKGDTVFVEGKIQTREYQDTNNEKQYITEVIADKFKFWSKKDEVEESSEELIGDKPPF